MTGSDLPPPPIDISNAQWNIVSQILQKHVPNYEVWVFGSRASSKSWKYSDLDLVIIAPAPLPISLMSMLAEEFCESDLPWKVDILDWAATSEEFRQIIQTNRVVVQLPSS